MASLSRQLRINKIKKRTASEAKLDSAVDQIDSVNRCPRGNLSPPEMLREETISDAKLELQIAEPECSDFTNCLFVSDRKLGSSTRKKLVDFTDVRSFDADLFANRCCEMLLEDFHVSNIWLNISNRSARDWLCKNLKKNESYTVIAVYSGNKRQKWLTDLEKTECVATVCKTSELNQLKSLSLDELRDNLANSFTLHPPANVLTSICGLSRMLNPVQK